jgi:hypothetical protein
MQLNPELVKAAQARLATHVAMRKTGRMTPTNAVELIFEKTLQAALAAMNAAPGVPAGE